jgi:hypothetical protein
MEKRDAKRAPSARERSEQRQRERRAGGTSRQREENPAASRPKQDCNSFILAILLFVLNPLIILGFDDRGIVRA